MLHLHLQHKHRASSCAPAVAATLGGFRGKYAEQHSAGQAPAAACSRASLGSWLHPMRQEACGEPSH